MTSSATNEAQRPHVVFVHGFMDNADGWSGLIDRLQKAGYPSTACDLRGAGRKQASEGPFTLEQGCTDIRAVIEEVGGDVVLVGHSMGAQIAELAATAHPERVAALILITPTPLGGRTMPDAVRDGLRNAGGDVGAQRAIRQAFSTNLSDQKLETLTDPALIMGKAAVEGYYDAFTGGHELGKEPVQYKGPTLLVGTLDDPVISSDLIREMRAERFPSATVRFIEDSGHWPQMEQSGACAAVILEQLSSLG